MVDADLLLAILTFFVFLCAIAMCVQAGFLFGIYKAATAMRRETQAVMPQVKTLMTKAEGVLEQSRKSVAEITTKANDLAGKANELAAQANGLAVKANEMLDIGKAQMVKVDSVITDAAGRAKVQIERAELVVDDTMSRVNQTVTAVHEGVLRPVREIHAIATGIRAAIDHMLRGGRPDVSQATQEDELFI